MCEARSLSGQLFLHAGTFAGVMTAKDVNAVRVFDQRTKSRLIFASATRVVMNSITDALTPFAGLAKQLSSLVIRVARMQDPTIRCAHSHAGVTDGMPKEWDEQNIACHTG